MVGECSSLEPCLSSSPDRDSPVPDDSINGCNYILTYVTNYYIDGTEWDGLCRGRVGRGGVRRKGNRKSTVPASRLFCFPLLSSALLCFTLLYSTLLCPAHTSGEPDADAAARDRPDLHSTYYYVVGG